MTENLTENVHTIDFAEKLQRLAEFGLVDTAALLVFFTLLTLGPAFTELLINGDATMTTTLLKINGMLDQMAEYSLLQASLHTLMIQIPCGSISFLVSIRKLLKASPSSSTSENS